MNAAAVLTALAQQGVVPRGLCLDSRQVAPGEIFVALKGGRTDGRAYIEQAVARGAAGVILEAGHDAASIAVPHVAVGNLAAHLGEIASLVYNHPSEHIWLAGVTGTNGKTSVTQWIAQGMSHLGRKCAVIGTLGNGFPDQLTASLNTTPDAIAVQRTLAGLVDQGAQACAMEVSSIGLDQARTGGVAFDVAVFTNLTRDHLDYHGDMAAYAAAKERLFAVPGLSAAVLNLDDPCGARLAATLAGCVPTLGYTLEAKGGTDRVLAARALSMTPQGIAFELDGVSFDVPVIGRFNAANVLAVVGALVAGDENLVDIAGALRRIKPPPGRMQTVGGKDAPLVVVDYAHTPDALEKVLVTLRETATARGGKLICVFGCGGERDPGKRPQMGALAERLADRVWLTNDNPRGENPVAILDAIRAGMTTPPAMEADRAAAIGAAVKSAAATDVVLVAGKGHEPYQEIAGARLPFSDIAAAGTALEAWR